MARLFAVVATEVATVAAARSSAFRLTSAACARSRAAEPPHPSLSQKMALNQSKLWGIKNSPDIRRRHAQPSPPEPLTVHSPFPSYFTTVTKRGRLLALCHGVMVYYLVWGVGQVGCPPWYTESITGVVFCTTQTSAFTSQHCLGEGWGIGAAGAGAAWGGRSSAEATSGCGERQMRQFRWRSLGGRTRLAGRAPESTGAASTGERPRQNSRAQLWVLQ
jgi:hypothetical protein